MVALGINQAHGVNAVALQLLDAIFVDDGFLKGGFQLPTALLTLFGVPDGSGLIKADLQMTHEGINRWPFGHG